MSLLRMSRKPPITISPDATILEAIQLMSDQRVGAVAITQDGKLEGIFTERDVMKKVILSGVNPGETPLREVMTTEIKTATDAASVADAMELLSRHRIRHLPIVDDAGHIEGMLSLRYLLHDRMDELLNELQGLDSYLGADGPGG